MSFVTDRVSQTAANPGSGAVTPSGSVSGYQTFASSVTTGAVVTIAIESTTPGDWEVCDATWNGTTLTRGEISGSSTGSRVTFTTTVNVFLTPSARALKGTRSGTVILRSLGNFGVI
jgi:hypothetical protein